MKFSLNTSLLLQLLFMEQDSLPEKGEGITEIKTTSEIYAVCKLVFKSIYVTEKPLWYFADG